jgi:group II intron reverse transcriptase/maturase
MKKSNPERKKKRKEMSTSERLSRLQLGLYRKAKQEPDYRFYILYDKLQLDYVLKESWKRVRMKGGAAGVDGISIADLVKQRSYENMLEELREELSQETYRPQSVKRVYLPKANGGQRPIGIPTVRDRVVQTACKLVLEPIFEADFEDSSYGFRPNRSSKDAIRKLREELYQGRTEILDADLSSYFDTIPHTKLLKTVATRISDSKILRLLKLWLKTPIDEDGQLRGGKKNKVGTPQGGVISPLLANIYLHLLDKIVNKSTSLFSRHDVKIIRYADDFVLMGKRIPEQVLEQLKAILSKMELRLNQEKTKVVQAKQSSFDFLGFTIRYDRDLKGRPKRYWNIIPSKKSEQKMRDNIKTYLRGHVHYGIDPLVPDLNRKIVGWINYFTIDKVSYPARSKRRLRYYLWNRLNRYYKRKSQRKSKLYGRGAFDELVKWGLVDPALYHPKTPAKA